MHSHKQLFLVAVVLSSNTRFIFVRADPVTVKSMEHQVVSAVAGCLLSIGCA